MMHEFHSPRVSPGDDQPLTEETVDSGYEIGLHPPWGEERGLTKRLEIEPREAPEICKFKWREIERSQKKLTRVEKILAKCEKDVLKKK